MKYTVMVPCPNCNEEHGGKIEMVVTHDPGYYRNANGDGLPPSTDVECAAVCDVCGGDVELTAAQWEAVDTAALESEPPSREDCAPEVDD